MTTGDVTVVVLGSGDAFASGGRFHACFLVEAPQRRFLIDCGASAPVSMKRYGIDSASVDAVVISHLHGDHFGGIPFLALDAEYLAGRTRALVVAGPPGVAERVGAAMEVMYPSLLTDELGFAIDYGELHPGRPADIAGAVVTAHPARHGSGAPAYSLCVEVDGKKVGYSGDTGWSETLLEVASGADLFICEASHFAGDPEGHLSYQMLVRRRADFDCRRMVLTHMGDDVLEHLDSLEIEPASDGMRIVL
jgi:ribonuclease BN (tRNA processing enzyme)